MHSDFLRDYEWNDALTYWFDKTQALTHLMKKSIFWALIKFNWWVIHQLLIQIWHQRTSYYSQTSRKKGAEHEFFVLEEASDALKNHVFYKVSQANWENAMTIGLSVYRKVYFYKNKCFVKRKVIFIKKITVF